MKRFFKRKDDTRLNYINYELAKKNIIELNAILGNKKEIFVRNFMAGISRGVGIGIGVTIITAIVVYILQRVVRLNIPLIGEYISDILEIVGNNKTNNLY